MSPSIWTRCAGKAELGTLSRRAVRVVEGQHVVSTRKLVDSEAEQRVLEELIEQAKPPVPAEPEFADLHYLLVTPFRYPPLRHGSRFGTRAERGIWYGAEHLATTFAEAAYYRLFFLEGTTAELAPVMVDVTTFTVRLSSPRAVDLTTPPFARYEAEISSPVRYGASQQLGSDMRSDGVELFRYRSARDTGGGASLGVLSPRAFAARRPASLATWYCVATREAVEFSARSLLDRLTYRYPRSRFEIEGKLPMPVA